MFAKTNKQTNKKEGKSSNVEDNVYVDSVLLVENLHVAVSDRLDLRSLLVLLLVIFLSKPKKTHGGVVLRDGSDAANVAEQKIHGAVATEEFIQHVVQKRQAIVAYAGKARTLCKTLGFDHNRSYFPIEVHVATVRNIARRHETQLQNVPVHSQDTLLECHMERVSP